MVARWEQNQGVAAKQPAQVRRAKPRHRSHTPACTRTFLFAARQFEPGGMIGWPISPVSEVLGQLRLHGEGTRIGVTAQTPDRWTHKQLEAHQGTDRIARQTKDE